MDFIRRTIIFMILINWIMSAAQAPAVQKTLFEGGKISTEHVEYGSCISQDGTEIYFARSQDPWGSSNSRSTIFYSYKSEGQWSEPEIASFSGQYDDSDPHLSSDGNRIFFISGRRDSVDNKLSDIWVVHRDIYGPWGEPQRLAEPINSKQREWSPRTDSAGNLYFASDRNGGYGQGDLYVSKLVHGQYQPPENLGNSINLETGEWNLDISHGGEVLIFEASGRTENKSPYGDLYISFKKGSNWSVPQNLAEINTGGSDLYPQFIRGDGLLFYSSSDSLKSRNTNIYVLPFQKNLDYYKERAVYR